VVRYGVHVFMAVLDEPSHIKARQALILRLRVLVPAIILPTIVLGVAVLVLGGSTGPVSRSDAQEYLPCSSSS
jgi:hypothetical protein